MTDNFIAFFYRERLIVTVVTMLIIAGGILALETLGHFLSSYAELAMPTAWSSLFRT